MVCAKQATTSQLLTEISSHLYPIGLPRYTTNCTQCDLWAARSAACELDEKWASRRKSLKIGSVQSVALPKHLLIMKKLQISRKASKQTTSGAKVNIFREEKGHDVNTADSS